MQPDDFYEFPAIERDRDERLAEEAGEQLGGSESVYFYVCSNGHYFRSPEIQKFSAVCPTCGAKP